MANTNEIAKMKTFLDVAALPVLYEELVDVGEVPYQANLQALKAIDIKNDRDTGKKAVDTVVKGLDEMITKLETLKNATRIVGKRASAILRAPQDGA